MRRMILIAVSLVLSTPAVAVAQPRSVGPDVPAEIPAAVYKARRDKLAQQLGTCVGALKSFPGGEENGFDPYFFYLTGIAEPGAVLLVAPKEPIYKQTLSLAPRDPEMEIWEGYREPLSPELKRKYMVDQVSRSRGSIPRQLGKALNRSRCYAKLRAAFRGKNDIGDSLGKYLSSYSARTEQRWQQLRHLRAVKGPEEILRMEKAIAITIEGHRAAVLSISPGVTERQVAAKIDGAFFAHGATGLAFPSIVGAGPNAAVLHWTKRDRAIESGDLVLVDIGASYGGYAADVTRTYPMSGKFTAEQRKVYETVLAVQNKVIAAVRPGVSLERLHKIASDELEKRGYDLPHGIGHFVGLEVHDVGDSGAPLEAGMVITVEPGIYLKDKLGVRIEDMVLVTSRGSKLMTAGLPRGVAEVEAWMERNRASK